jgi:hypothetical protein
MAFNVDQQTHGNMVYEKGGISQQWRKTDSSLTDGIGKWIF